MPKIKLKNILFILLGAAIFGFGIIHFNIENNLAEGGFTGITLILFNLFGLDPAISNLVLNIPLFIVGWRLLGRNTFIYTIIGTVGVSFFLWLFQYHIRISIPLHNDLTLAALFAGVFIGIGLGIIFRNGGTTGGVDIIARLANKYIGWSIGKTMFLFDAFVIVCATLTYLNYKEAMYTLVAVFVGARVIDFIQEGAYAAKAAMIISENNAEIANRIIKELDRGATVLNGRGTFTGAQKEVLYCVIARNEIFRLRNLIQQIDPHAFVAVNDVHDVLGEGFTLDENKNPLHN
ncbi:YitT family protein [Pseudalkalibacillus decolorationis]|uniref:YitT family protein n=1 Tax=Pseudalkalibacillus decolorationis TaxID=163879 RepID=UPI0021497E69|nr:YitT family protein [Pseudalkalibacillus decolorationis]